MIALPKYTHKQSRPSILPQYNRPDTTTTWFNTNASNLLTSAIRDAVLKGELATAKHYTDNLFLEGGLNTPGGYGASLGFNTSDPFGGRYKWNMNIKVPINL
mgnify:CR=1 FL=1